MGTRGAAVAASLATATGSAARSGRVARRQRHRRRRRGRRGVGGRARSCTSAPPAACRGPPTIGSPERGCLVPGFVDCHVHLPFVGWRADEFEARLRGVALPRAPRRRTAASSGPAGCCAEATDDEVLAFCRPLARRDARARHHRDGAEDRLRARRRGRAPAGAARAAARRRGRPDVLRHAARVPRGPERMAARGLGAGGVRRADPARGGRGARRRGRHLRRGHRVLARRPRRGRRGGGRRRAAAARARRPTRADAARRRRRSRWARGAPTT